MPVTFVAGAMNLPWMAALTVLMTLEKLLRISAEGERADRRIVNSRIGRT